MVDYINGTFVTFCGVFILFNVKRLYKDKKVRGVSPWCVLFFTVYAVWNVLFCVSIGQMTSAYTAVLNVVANVMWLIQIVYYNWKEK